VHVEVLVEEPSAQIALETLLPMLLGPQRTWNTHSFRDKPTLLRELPKRLRGYGRWLPSDWRIVVLLDEDRQNCCELKGQLDQVAREAGLADRVLNRIAVEELEAWWFGDIPALRAAYPRLPATLGQRRPYRDPDAVPGGTWEALDRELRRAGYREGLVKTEAARRVARYMDPEHNRSRSFQAFRSGLQRLAGVNL
jgi:hypothetical protein